jgi:hypothetical protein
MSDYMDPKMWCIWKPAQSGKTRSMQEWIRDNEETAEHLNILITSNNRLLVSQLTKRMRDNFSDSSSESDDGSDDGSEAPDDHIDTASKIFSWMSGTKKTNISVAELADNVKEDNVNMVCCCAHKARFKYIIKLLENLEKSKNFSKRISVWIDEADVSVKMWARTFNFTKFVRVDRVVLVSATFDSVFKYYKNIRIRGYETVYNATTYLRYGECNVVPIEDNKGSALSYLAGILAEHPEIAKPGMKLFAPGEIEVASHDAIANLLLSKGFAVLILNGQRKVVILPTGEVIKVTLSLSSEAPGELSEALSELYSKNDLSRFPFAVTGQICLGRGITLQSQTLDKKTGELIRQFMFTHGVVPDLKDFAAIYQCLARMLGNTKEFHGFEAPTIYCSHRTNVVCEYLARVSENIARIVHEKGLINISLADIEKLVGVMDEIRPLTPEEKERILINSEHQQNVKLEEFATMKDLHIRFKEILKERHECKWSGRSPAEPQRDADGNYKCSIGQRSEVQTADAIRKFAVGMRSWGSGATEAKRGDLIHRVYASVDAGVPKLFLRWTYSSPLPDVPQVANIPVA